MMMKKMKKKNNVCISRSYCTICLQNYEKTATCSSQYIKF